MTTLDAKALRLRLEGRVIEVEGRTFMVRGDHGIYVVTVPAADATKATCSCPALGACSHKISVNGVLLDEAEANEGRPGAVTPDAPDTSREIDASDAA